MADFGINERYGNRGPGIEDIVLAKVAVAPRTEAVSRTSSYQGDFGNHSAYRAYAIMPDPAVVRGLASLIKGIGYLIIAVIVYFVLTNININYSLSIPRSLTMSLVWIFSFCIPALFGTAKIIDGLVSIIMDVKGRITQRYNTV